MGILRSLFETLCEQILSIQTSRTLSGGEILVVLNTMFLTAQ
jgi:hypothetical protein